MPTYTNVFLILITNIQGKSKKKRYHKLSFLIHIFDWSQFFYFSGAEYPSSDKIISLIKIIKIYVPELKLPKGENSTFFC